MNVCVDASLVVKWLVPEEGSEEALRLYRKWMKEDVGLIAPGLIDYEVGTVLRQKFLRGFIGAEDLFPIFDFYKRLNLFIVHATDLVSQALGLAATLDQPTTYDVSYLLIAKQQGVDFVTADKRFCETARSLFPFVKFYRDLDSSFR